jgi:hypothetical protein
MLRAKEHLRRALGCSRETAESLSLTELVDTYIEVVEDKRVANVQTEKRLAGRPARQRRAAVEDWNLVPCGETKKSH